MALLHTLQLYAGGVTGTPSWHTVYTVPSGYRVILRNIQGQNQSGSSQTIYIGRSSVQFDLATANGGGSIQRSYYLVLMEGQTLTLYNDLSAGFQVVCSGSIYYV